MSESGTPAALRCTAPCLPQLTKLREELKSCAKCCSASKNPAIILAKLAVETTDKHARFQAAETVLPSPPAVPSNLSRRNGASLNEARVQTSHSATHVKRSSCRPVWRERSYSNCPKTDPVSRCPQPCCSTASTSATKCADTDLLQAEAGTSRHLTAWGDDNGTFNCFIQSQKLLDIQVQTPYRLGTTRVPCT